jgi:hypothetical protein
MKVRLLKILRKQASKFLELRDYGARYSNMAGKCRYVLVRKDSEEFMANGNNIAYLLSEADKIKRNYILSEVEDYRKKLRIYRQEYKIIKLE